MKTSIIISLTVLFCISVGHSQDCFMPPDGSTLYTTTNPVYSAPSQTGFVTFANNLSGDWSVASTTGDANISFTDNTGRTSTQSITGTNGTITMDNTVISVPATTPVSCTQTFNIAVYDPTVGQIQNPSITAPCPLDIVLVLDESESIDNMSTETIENAVLALANGLEGSFSRMAIVEFDTEAENISINGSTALQVVDAAFISGLSNYLSTDYQPMGIPINLIGGTNWEDALIKANSVVGADYILMLTDGRPTFYSTSMGMSGVAGEGNSFDITALEEARITANMIKDSGKHIFVAGVDFPADVQPIRDITGNNEFVLGQSLEQLINADYSIVPPSDIVELFENIGELCGPPELVPTMGEWASFNLGLILCIFCVIAIRQRRAVLV